MTRRIVATVVGILSLFALGTACTPHQVAVFSSLGPAEQDAVIQALRSQGGGGGGGDCFSALGHFPGNHAKARQVIMRESGNNPGAANRSSSARGCWQTMMSIHSAKYYQVGCNPNQWSNAVCNTKVAALLYQSSGWSPWAASA